MPPRCTAYRGGGAQWLASAPACGRALWPSSSALPRPGSLSTRAGPSPRRRRRSSTRLFEVIELAPCFSAAPEPASSASAPFEPVSLPEPAPRLHRVNLTEGVLGVHGEHQGRRRRRRGAERREPDDRRRHPRGRVRRYQHRHAASCATRTRRPSSTSAPSSRGTGISDSRSDVARPRPTTRSSTLRGSDMVFVTVGEGGVILGLGAAPVVARISREPVRSRSGSSRSPSSSRARGASGRPRRARRRC